MAPYAGPPLQGSRPRNHLLPGVYAPMVTFFDPETEDLDLLAIRKHAVRLARAGLAGLVTLGSNGEAVHLTNNERTLVTSCTREALGRAGFSHIPIIAGASAQSVRSIVELCQEAQRAGAEYTLLVPLSYYRTAMDSGRPMEYFIQVADLSPPNHPIQLPRCRRRNRHGF